MFKLDRIIIVAFIFSVTVIGCTADSLEENVFSELDENTVFQSDKSVRSVLFGAYNVAHDRWRFPNHRITEQWTTDNEWSTGGFVNRFFQVLSSFTWGPNLETLPPAYNDFYQAIRNANVIIENKEKINGDIRSQFVAEARFVRAMAYYRLYSWFGPVPLRVNSEQPLELSRATEQEMKDFLENEFLDIIPDLPNPDEIGWGRAHKGAAMGFLTKFYLNTKQWQKSADMANNLMNMDYYYLFPEYEDLWKVENNENKEVVYAIDSNPAAGLWEGMVFMNGWFPPGFFKEPKSGFTFGDNMSNWAVQYRLRDKFYNSFPENDKRKNLIITEYINFDGDTVSLMNSNNLRSFKYWPDENAIAFSHGNDLPVIRYTDILLSRAEALNEINGPNQESINLINMVRQRAGISDLNLSDFGSKEQLRDHILKERGWEFYSEQERRQDLIRHGKFIEFAIQRGASSAQDFHRRFPIPQTAMNANPKLEQNPGY